MDISTTCAPKSDQLNYDDLIGGPRTIEITKVSKTDGEQPISIGFKGDNNKPYKPSKGMRRVMVKGWGKDASKYEGRFLTIYGDPEVVFGGVKVGGIRISHMSHIDGDFTMAMTASKTVRKPYKVKLLIASTSATPAESDLAIIKSGADAAALGVEAYTAWGKTLTPEQRASVQDRLSGWLEVAKKSDADEAAASTAGA